MNRDRLESAHPSTGPETRKAQTIIGDLSPIEEIIMLIPTINQILAMVEERN